LSTLTKLFVVLLIICSLLMTAAVVVFVNRTEDFRVLHGQAQKSATLQTALRQAAENEANAAKIREADTAKSLNAKLAETESRIASLNQATASDRATINDLQKQIATLTANNTAQVATLDQMARNIKDIQDRNKVLLDENGQLVIRNADLGGSNVDLAKRLDEVERERRFLTEKVVQLEQDFNRAVAKLTEHRIDWKTPTAIAAAANLRGVIRDVRFRDGLAYAEISLGSTDKVAKGMQFTVIDPVNNLFMGKLTVDEVDQNTAVGRLEGPRIEQVSRDHVVVSQL
jgi:predicted  nucleic acid-binding Zn-ribbon protein